MRAGTTMPELRFVRAQDRHLSLWQSAVAENIRAQLRGPDTALSASDVLGHPLMSAANDHVEAALAGEPPTAPDPDAGDPQAIAAYLSRVGLEKGKALADGDAERAAAADVEFRKYSDEDPGFLSCATTYAKYYAEYKGVFAYNDWTKQGGGNINYGVVNYRLPDDARVGIVGDWGTGLGDAKGLLKDLMTAHSPAALIHLGDIYYSATPDECAVNYADIITAVFDEVLGPGKRIPVYTLAGNHDYYALGHPLYQTFNAMNAAIPGAAQVASYFCLRTADNGWQFLGMDTGYFDANPADQINPTYAGPWLQDSEARWMQHKLDTFPGVTILLSHHQLYTANAKLNGSLSPYKDLPYMNPFLYKVFAPYFTNDVAAWLWGHEHNLVLYQDNLFGLAKGRLVGCSAYEELTSADPYKVNYPEVPYLDPEKYRLDAAGGYYNHGYSVIDLAKRAQPSDPVSIEYYQFPSWGDAAPPAPASQLLYGEQLARPQGAPAQPVTFGTQLHLFAQEGLYVAPLYKQIEYYPTLSADQAVGLELANGSGVLRHGSEVEIKTTESVAGKYNVLGAWSTPTLYYDTPGSDKQVWRVQKRDPSQPEVHYGDEVCFVNKSYAGQSLMPYWSRVYGSVYLTTKAGDPYYWVMRPAVPAR
jgi:calcineurin-like phosphoesterase family protein